MVWDLPKSEKLDLNFFFKLCKGGISENPNLYALTLSRPGFFYKVN